MFVLTLLSVMICLVLFKHRREVGFTPLITILLSLLFLTLFSLEYSLGRVDYFNSDELYYLEGEHQFPNSISRFLWLFLNYIVLNYDIDLNGIMLKLVNIPISVGFLFVLWLIFNKQKKIFYLPLLLPYFCYVATLNLRDMAILLFTALTVYLIHHHRVSHNLYGLLSATALFLLRPFVAFLVILITGWQKVYGLFRRQLYRGIIKRGSLHKVLVFALVLIMFLPVAFPKINQQVDSYYSWFLFTTGEGQASHIESVSAGYATGSRIQDFLVSSVRYVVTPFPHSLLERVLMGGSDIWGIVDDIIRLWNQIGYYVILALLVFNIKYIPAVLKSLTRAQTALVVSLLMYWPIYSFHLYGAVHQRLKIPFQIALFLLMLLVLDVKRRRREQRNILVLRGRANVRTDDDNKDNRASVR